MSTDTAGLPRRTSRKASGSGSRDRQVRAKQRVQSWIAILHTTLARCSFEYVSHFSFCSTGAAHTDIYLTYEQINALPADKKEQWLSLAYQVDSNLMCGFDPEREPLYEELIVSRTARNTLLPPLPTSILFRQSTLCSMTRPSSVDVLL